MRENRFFSMADNYAPFFSILAHFSYFVDYQHSININMYISHTFILP